MAHHRHAPDASSLEEKESPEFSLFSAESPVAVEKRDSSKIETAKQENRQREKVKGFLNHEIAGFPWPFVVVMSIIAIGVLGLVLKLMGVF